MSALALMCTARHTLKLNAIHLTLKTSKICLRGTQDLHGKMKLNVCMIYLFLLFTIGHISVFQKIRYMFHIYIYKYFLREFKSYLGTTEFQ